LRVLLVLAESAGGIAAHVRSLCELLPAQGVDVTVIGPHFTLERLHLTSRSDHTVAAPVGGGAPTAWRAARRLIRQESARVDLVHAHGLRAAAACGHGTAGRPLLATWHNAARGGVGRRVAHRGLERVAARVADLTLTASDDLAERARQAGGHDVRTVLVVAPPLPAASRSRAEVRAELGVGDRPLVLAVGRLHPQKRWDVLVDAAAGWSSRLAEPPAVVIAGAGPTEDRLRSRIGALGAPVTLLGHRADVADLLAAADVVALTSEWEARALVAQEALAQGVPLVATSVGGIPDLVGDAAVLVPPGDADALRAALDRVLAEAPLRRELRERGRRRAAAWPDLAASVAELAGIYRSVARAARTRGRRRSG
jgi:glycosyltransferase involved in cell wall biosynthesis